MPAPVLTIGGVNQTSKIQNSTLSLGLNKLDVTLVDPATMPALSDAVTCTNPTWAGTVTSFTTVDNDRTGHKWVRVTCTNADAPGAASSGVALHDTHGDYRNLSITKTINQGTTETRGQLETFVAGIDPMETFTLTAATHGYTDQSFTARDVSVSWLNTTTPLYRIDFGDAIVDMSVWVNSAEAGVLPITTTKITDDAVTTPKIAAGAVTATEISAGVITADKLTVATRGSSRNLVQNGSFEDGPAWAAPTGWTTGVSSGESAYQEPTSVAMDGANVLALVCAASGAGNYANADGLPFPVAAGDVLSVSCWERSIPATTTGIYIGVRWLDYAGATISPTFIHSDGAGGTSWALRSGYATAPAGACFGVPLLFNYEPATANYAIFDAFTIERVAVGLENTTGEVLIDADGVTITNGALTVTNPGATVIIDGTSNMFKIVATGTLDITPPAAQGVAGNQVDLGHLGLGYTSAFACWIELSGTAFADALPYVEVAYATGHVSDSVQAFLYYDSGTEHTTLNIVWQSFAGIWYGTGDKTIRYYIYKEAAI